MTALCPLGAVAISNQGTIKVSGVQPCRGGKSIALNLTEMNLCEHISAEMFGQTALLAQIR